VKTFVRILNLKRTFNTLEMNLNGPSICFLDFVISKDDPTECEQLLPQHRLKMQEIIACIEEALVGPYNVN